MHEIVKMVGTYDGKEIVFNKIDTHSWEVEVPTDLEDGKYIIEIYAYLKSGAVAYTTATLYLCDAKCTKVEIVDNDIFAEMCKDKYIAEMENNSFICTLVANNLGIEMITDKVIATMPSFFGG